MKSKRNHLLLLSLCISLFLVSAMAASVHAASFSDVPSDAWYTEAVDYVSSREIMNGVSDTAFDPQGATSRGMFVTILHRLAGEPYVNYAMSFTDVPTDAYYTEAIRWAVSEKIADGKTASLFSPDEPITREEMASMVYQYEKNSGVDTEKAYNPAMALLFDDFGEVDESLVPAMRYCCARTYFAGNGAKRLFPKDNATRAETAAVIMRYLMNTAPDYSDRFNWALWNEGENKRADVFMLCPLVDKGRSGNYNMNIPYDFIRPRFEGALRMEVPLYADECTLYAPYYRQITLPAYAENGFNADEYYVNIAYGDVKRAFEYYLANSDPDRPFILSGYSQGAQMALKLLEDYFNDEALSDRLIAAYLPGWHITEDDVKAYPHLHLAEGETDTGVIITYECEAVEMEESPIIPKGMHVLSINPLNWKTDSTPADKTENKGACATDYSGSITQEIPQLTGAYLDPLRGTLKATDVSPNDFPGDIFPDGSFHSYDLTFFFRNLQENVGKRVEAYFANTNN